VVLSRSLRDIVVSGVNKQLRKAMKTQILLQSRIDSPLAFCLVHWNASDFLLLTVKQIKLLYPNSKIYILDNGSQQMHLTSIKTELKKFNNVTLFSAIGCPNWAKKLGLEYSFDWQSHTSGLQFLLNYSAKQLDKIAIFLDQDCILSTHIDELFSKFNNDVFLIGARDHLVIPRDYGPLRKGHLRWSYCLIHPSFLILQPIRINKLFGNSAFYDKRTDNLELYGKIAHPEPYHGISFKASKKILFLETSMHEKTPLLTSYSYNGTIYAWHAWYSSRTTGVQSKSLDGLPVSWLQDVRKTEYEFMRQLNKNAASNLGISNNSQKLNSR
jgi:hypothetical protein